MYKKKLSRVALSGMIAISMIPGVAMPVLANTDKTTKVEAQQSNAIVNICFKLNWETLLGGDFQLTEGVHNYSELYNLLPEGYEITTKGDFYVNKNGETKLEVNVEKVNKNVTMSIRFMDGDTFVAGGDYTLTKGAHNYSELSKYVPEGYEMTVSGDFTAAEGLKLDVNIKKSSSDVVMNVVFKYNGEVIKGGDYFLPKGVQNYSILEDLVPEGYVMSESGDFTVVENGFITINLDRVDKNIIMNVVFRDGDIAIAGGDYTLLEGIHNYTDLAQYVPEGYEMTVSGDFYAREGSNLIVNVAKKDKPCIMNVRFMDRDKFVAGGDYTLLEGINSYSVLSQYVPEGYRMTVSGDFYATEGGKLEVSIEKIPATKNEAKLVIKVVDLDTKKELSNTLFISNEKGTQGEYYTFVQGTDFEVKLPKGYRLAKGVSELGDIQVEYGTTTTATVYAQKDALNGSVDTHKEDASKENPDKAEPKKDSEKSGKTQTSLATGLFGSFAGISASSAAIMALLRRKRNKR